MSFQFNGLKASVTISGAISTTSYSLTSTQTSLTIKTTMTGAEQVAYTVPAGKRFLLFGASGYPNNSGYTLRNDVGTDLIYRVTSSTAPGNHGSFFSPIPIYVAIAGEEIKVQGTNASPMWIYGILEDA